MRGIVDMGCDLEITVGDILQPLIQNEVTPSPPLKFFLPFIVTTTMDFPAKTLDDPSRQLHIFAGISKGITRS